MNIVWHTLKFVLSAALGYASVFLVMAIALQTGVIDALPADQYLYDFKMAYFGGGLMSAILGTGLGVISFFTNGRMRTALLLLPLLMPLLYSLIVLGYFSALPAPVL